MHDNIAKKCSKSLVIPTGKTTDYMAFKVYPDTILLLKVDRFEGILYRIKIDGMMNDYVSSCNSWRFKKIYTNIAKKPFAIFSHTYLHNHGCYSLEIFSRYYATIKKLTVQKICESNQI